MANRCRYNRYNAWSLGILCLLTPWLMGLNSDFCCKQIPLRLGSNSNHFWKKGSFSFNFRYLAITSIGFPSLFYLSTGFLFIYFSTALKIFHSPFMFSRINFILLLIFESNRCSPSAEDPQHSSMSWADLELLYLHEIYSS